MPPTHQCPGKDCTASVKQSELACKKHWFQISKPARDEVWAAYKSGDLMRHLDAMQTAIEEIA